MSTIASKYTEIPIACCSTPYILPGEDLSRWQAGRWPVRTAARFSLIPRYPTRWPTTISPRGPSSRPKVCDVSALIAVANPPTREATSRFSEGILDDIRSCESCRALFNAFADDVDRRAYEFEHRN